MLNTVTVHIEFCVSFMVDVMVDVMVGIIVDEALSVES
jgi:hypothetical protein